MEAWVGYHRQEAARKFGPYVPAIAKRHPRTALAVGALVAVIVTPWAIAAAAGAGAALYRGGCKVYRRLTA